MKYSACGLYVAYYLVQNSFKYDIDFSQLNKIMLAKNCRQWNLLKLRNFKRNKIAMCEPNLDLSAIKQKDPSNKELQSCSSIEKLFKNFGKPNGI